ncbi:non-ribosomal peptide synthetase/MFS transporter [Nocardia callitridis]
MFDSSRVDALIDHLLTLLTAAMNDPAIPVTRLRWLTDDERDRLINRWNDTSVDVPANRGIHQLLEYHARTTPHAAALTYRDQTMTYEQLNRAANRLAHLLRSLGIGPGARAAICLDRGTDFFVAMWAVLKAGGGYVPLDPAYPPRRLSFMLRDSAPLVLITRQDMAVSPQAPDGVVLVALDRDSAEIVAQPGTDPVPVGDPSDTAYLTYTSGSSGDPKGVVVEHGHLLHAAAMWQHAYQLEPSWTFQQAASFSFDMFVGETLRAHCAGGRLLVIPRETLLDPGELFTLMSTEQVACTELVPAVLRRLLAYVESTEQSLDFVKVLIGGGEKWSVQEYERARRLVGPHGRVVNSYGVTEVTVDNVYFDGDVEGLPADAPLPIGRPFPNNRVYVLDAHQSPVPAGIVGELYLGGRGVARGYHERERLNAERFLPDPFDSRDGGRMYRTGDSARWRGDGVVEFLGRLDDQVKINGYRVELNEVEAALTALPAVAAVGAAVHRTSTDHAYLVGYVAARPGADAEQLDENAIRLHLAEVVPPHLVPARIIVLPSLPLTPNGKLDRKALPIPAVADRAVSITARTTTEQRIAAVWATVLEIDTGPDTIGIDDSFFSLGGDSFSALRVARRLDPAPPLLELYRNPTIRMLAGWFDSEPEAADHPRPLLHRLTATDADRDGLTVVAIPYSGGSAVSYQPLADSMPIGWALYAAELPGHDSARPDEVLLGVEEIAASVVAEVRALTGSVLLYGHCLGVAATVEIAKRMEAEGLPLAGVGLGAAFPTARLPGRLFDLFYRLFPLDRFVSDRHYLSFLRSRGGFIDLGSPEEEAFVLRNVRRDARDAEEYFTEQYRHSGQAKLEAPIISIVGARDRATELYEERHHEWEQLAESVDLAVIPRAGHFFVRTHARQLAEALHDKFGPPAPKPVSPKVGAPAESRVVAARPSRSSPEPSLRRYAVVAGGQTISMLGSAISALVLSIWVFRETGSITQFSVISALGMLPGIIVSPFAGAVADAADRRMVMLASDFGAAIAMGIVAVLVYSGDVHLWQVYLAVIVTSVAVAFQRPAYLAAVAQLVPKRYLGRTNGITQLGVGAAAVVAPIVGIWLIGHIDVGGAILLDIATFAVAVSALLLVRFPDRLFRRREERFAAEILNGWRYIVRRPSLLAALRYFLVDNAMFLIGFAVIMPLLLIEQSAWVLSAALTAGGLGALSAGLVMGLWGGVARRANGMLFFMGVCSVGITAVGVSPSPILVIGGMFLMSFGESMAIAHWMTLLQTKVGVELQGRVLSCFLTVMLLTEPLSYLLIGPLAETYVQPLLKPGRPLADLLGPLLGTGPARGLALLLVISGLLQFGWAVRGWLYRPVRFIEDALPDAIPPDEIGDRDALQRHEDSRLLDQH